MTTMIRIPLFMKGDKPSWKDVFVYRCDALLTLSETSEKARENGYPCFLFMKDIYVIFQDTPTSKTYTNIRTGWKESDL